MIGPRALKAATAQIPTAQPLSFRMPRLGRVPARMCFWDARVTRCRHGQNGRFPVEPPGLKVPEGRDDGSHYWASIVNRTRGRTLRHVSNGSVRPRLARPDFSSTRRDGTFSGSAVAHIMARCNAEKAKSSKSRVASVAYPRPPAVRARVQAELGAVPVDPVDSGPAGELRSWSNRGRRTDSAAGRSIRNFMCVNVDSSNCSGRNESRSCERKPRRQDPVSLKSWRRPTVGVRGPGDRGPALRVRANRVPSSRRPAVMGQGSAGYCNRWPICDGPIVGIAAPPESQGPTAEGPASPFCRRLGYDTPNRRDVRLIGSAQTPV